ncbi:MAG: bifunctional methylenetetrahydrofolate dehydrogenase/methenyltetrahydrofolate cyclohydrolase FolD [Epsilonproteobacteria bacterium]|jgi:methylenetetrahydrofolate dehydrogenase (NADP+)/methenyltetrahydrofolate cyclohydrolase|uniref:Bifunctional protein FolD n=1 Tax=Sulfurospirillum cavolei TaxID=366522 RepID=A0A2D3W5T9_9BACT|nr:MULTISPECIES: bifunctional methylenetetrahydrofolate dehydrogenase/methenyltetrahydrofolate cyclohydrolase FolD [Sulfurospirillum]MCD8543752.1 bifunctional methylenetetrahydrofolate dehydrogenase/methenyltetrahydrofolate cyclohydrolase FolD [Sulfurospirillum cavolei]NCB53645.1 bifunctional methylenetetrahydrofolate dehydrogenase/methenyltetrahydrofolate cyclohydrolase FolD [Campylobacterota bacterium]KHG33311.1 MAG: 5,10-methylene-tetrahydrofolate cyclohydrolase [Sulfurospirillum sp. MES]MCP
MQILDGKALSDQIKIRLKKESEALVEKGITPGLAVILVGDDAASQTYVKMKEKACDITGIYSIIHKMPSSISQEKILETIAMINTNPNIDGVLVQLPLPKHIDTTKIIEAIEPRKDVDGFHPFNVGRLVAGLESFVPCTPLGVMRLLSHYAIDPKGLNACVVGASNIVGKPMMNLLLNAGATVDICHIFTKDLKEHTKKADLLIVGVGKQNLITEDMVKEGAIVVDIGINKTAEGRIVGDVDFENVAPKCSYITPVPGGVGPMTIAMLLENTVKAAHHRLNAK